MNSEFEKWCVTTGYDEHHRPEVLKYVAEKAWRASRQSLLTLLQSEEIRERAVNAMVREENQFDPPYISQARMFALAQAALSTIIEAMKEGK